MALPPGLDPLDLPTFARPEAPRRIPKLQVRNRIGGLSPPPGLGINVDEINPVNAPDASTTASIRGPSRAETPWDQITPAGRTTPNGRDTAVRPRMASPAMSWNSRDSGASPPPGAQSPSSPDLAGMQPAKKGRTGMFSFFSVKEPSTAAWEQYVQEQKAQGAVKGSKSVSMLGKKLPGTVPKVNSKWDGMPNHAQPSKTSLDLGSFIRGPSRTSGEISNRSRPSTSKSSTSGRSSDKQPELSRTTTGNDSTRKTSRPATSSRNKSEDAVRRPGTVRQTSKHSERAVPPARIEQPVERYQPKPPEAIPEMSLFFPPENVESPQTSTKHLTQPRKHESVPASLNDEFVPPQYSGSSNRHSSDEDDFLHITTDREFLRQTRAPRSEGGKPAHTLSKIPITLPDATPPQLDGTSRLPQTSPTVLVSGSEPPARMTTPQPKHFRSVNEIPQWPLPTSPQEVIIDPMESQAMAGQPVPLIARAILPIRSVRRTSASSDDESRNQGQNSSSTASPVKAAGAPPSTHTSTQIPVSSPQSSPQPVAPFSDFAFDFNFPSSSSSPSQATSSPAPPPIRLTRNFVPPRLLPGRVITRDTDLATIPESDTASLASRNSIIEPSDGRRESTATITSLQPSPALPESPAWAGATPAHGYMTNMPNANILSTNAYVSTSDDEEDDDPETRSSRSTTPTQTPTPSVHSSDSPSASSRASSEMSAQWYLSPRERLGLGIGPVKRHSMERPSWEIPPADPEPSPSPGTDTDTEREAPWPLGRGNSGGSGGEAARSTTSLGASSGRALSVGSAGASLRAGSRAGQGKRVSVESTTLGYLDSLGSGKRKLKGVFRR